MPRLAPRQGHPQWDVQHGGRRGHEQGDSGQQHGGQQQSWAAFVEYMLQFLPLHSYSCFAAAVHEAGHVVTEMF